MYAIRSYYDAAKEGGIFIRQPNHVIRNGNNFQKAWSGIGYISAIYSKPYWLY